MAPPRKLLEPRPTPPAGPPPSPLPGARAPPRSPGREPAEGRKDARPYPDRKWVRVSHSSAAAPSSAGREGPRRPRAGRGVGSSARCFWRCGLWPWGAESSSGSVSAGILVGHSGLHG
ncbi:PREDICTED: homeobox protein Hox-D4-like [Lipotes vexillifer]|uniref:Homeobox protein Hox-D4-like n=1 Tax=Lipotes vexillifer TaxID=118797 RepID=A0A340WWH8_LIPVE|nr:PREDICTED: homeobox protein Hox-D4-like [Lipotes vexillifer]